MLENEISFKADDFHLYGTLFVPETNELSYAAICICHGIPGTANKPDNGGYAALARKFCAAGFVTLIFNFRGTGRSQGNFDLLGWSRDLDAAVGLLSEQEEVDRSKISLVGFSGGAAVSIYVAAKDPRISSVVSLACPAEFIFPEENLIENVVEHFRSIGTIKDESFPRSIDEWWEGFNIISPIKWVADISPRPLYLIHGDKDELVSVDHANRLYKQARDPKEMNVIPGAGHQLRLEEHAVETALNWLKKINGKL
jgi:alpha/beta superfamily hydrolase